MPLCPPVAMFMLTFISGNFCINFGTLASEYQLCITLEFTINLIVSQGTSITYKPGLLYGGAIEHQCSCQRSIGYYLEGIICLAPFCKKPISLKLTGVTNDDTDPSVSVYYFDNKA